MPEYVNDRTCPACGKPTLYSATGAPGQQWACPDPDCVYAHGIPVEAWLFHSPGIVTRQKDGPAVYLPGWIDEALPERNDNA